MYHSSSSVFLVFIFPFTPNAKCKQENNTLRKQVNTTFSELQVQISIPSLSPHMQTDRSGEVPGGPQSFCKGCSGGPTHRDRTAEQWGVIGSSSAFIPPNHTFNFLRARGETCCDPNKSTVFWQQILPKWHSQIQTPSGEAAVAFYSDFSPPLPFPKGWIIAHTAHSWIPRSIFSMSRLNDPGKLQRANGLHATKKIEVLQPHFLQQKPRERNMKQIWNYTVVMTLHHPQLPFCRKLQTLLWKTK